MHAKRTPLWIFANILKWILLGTLLGLSLLPLLWLFVSSLRTNLELQISPFGWPAKIQWVNYVKALSMASLPRLLLNSVVVAVCAVIVNSLVTSMAAFILSREHFKGRDVIYTILTAGVLVPVISFMVPYFSLITHTGLYNTLTALIFVYTAVNIPVSIFLVTAFMKSIPKELEEAAIIDGCGFFKRFTKIILPLSRSGLVTAATFCFIYSWNEFLMAMLLTSSIESRTIQLGIKFFSSQFITDYSSMYAAVIITIIPSVAGYIFLHDKIIGGLTAGGVKG
ncbi:carbohydrate ABC transporter permease [Sphaerochaeta sp. PS]|uniref:carbohydrate ABC transporter permease n=1 Tax=Sphaerochaeta sp. PS TaxID=3076336 RepID=UPI0028A41262|nr:carbohydrate ABC transporter permease [Sphaerochaeta sp. PS]MDT4761241.1 carbohydrate ABC transporter permease [Sphaerochaeta sp. PS]